MKCETESAEPAWSSPFAKETKDDEQLPAQPVLMRKASLGSDNGLGVEVAGVDNSRIVEAMMRLDRVEKLEAMRKYKSMMSSFTNRSSLDDSFLSSFGGGFMKPDLAFDLGEIRKSLSQDEVSVLLHAKMDLNRSMHNVNSLMDPIDDDQSLDLNVDNGQHYDSWNVLLDDNDEHEYSIPFEILGTSADDIASMPHVLSPPLMESLYHFVPYSVSEQNFFMKYSLVRDGASFTSLLQHIRGSLRTIIALETTDGEVFGSFTSTQW